MHRLCFAVFMLAGMAGFAQAANPSCRAAR